MKLYLRVEATAILVLINLLAVSTLLSWLNEPNDLLLAAGVVGI